MSVCFKKYIKIAGTTKQKIEYLDLQKAFDPIPLSAGLQIFYRLCTIQVLSLAFFHHLM